MVYIKRGQRKMIDSGEYKGKGLERCTVAFDKATDMVTFTEKTKFAPFSMAWVLDTGDIYALNEADEWILQPHAQIIL